MNLEEVAKLAGVSRSTVSRVINDDPRVSDEARDRVRTVIRDTNFHPNAAARSLATSRTRIIGVMIPNHVNSIFTDPFFPKLLQGVAEACNAADQMLMLLMETSGEPMNSERIYTRVIQGRHLDGIIIASWIVEEPILQMLQQSHFPVVLVGRHPTLNLSYIDVDNRASSRDAVEHLIGHGRRRIATITGPANMIAAIDRHAGYVDALDAAGLPRDPALTVWSDFSRRGGYRSMATLLEGSERPDAVFVASDAMASGALQAIRDAGLRVPEDVAVMGFDGLEETLVSRSILSTVVQPTLDEGREAVRTLLELLDRPGSAPIQRILPTRLALQLSCGCAPRPSNPETALDASGGGELGL